MDSGKRSYSSTKSNFGKYKSDKVKDASKTSSSRQKVSDVHVPEQEVVPVQFPIVKQVDISRILPSYTLVLSRNQDDGVGMEDLDEIQQDFEKLLSTCAVRQRLLRSEVESIDRVEEKKEKKGKPYDKPSVKRKHIEEKPKYKDARNVAKVIKTKHTPATNFLNELPRYEVPKVIIPKHDVSDRFWISVDPYCQEVNKDNVYFLDELIKECSQEVDVKIPEIGEHYAAEWAENSIQTEQNNGAIKPSKKGNSTFNNEMKKNGIAMVESYPSPLTQRLLDTLIEEKVIKPIPTVYNQLKCTDYTIKANNGVRSLCLDRRLRKELFEQGVLDMEDVAKTFPQDDEIFLEIKKCQSELTVINKHNIMELNKLRTVVAKDLRKQDVKAALDKVDNQVMNLYNKILLAKQKHTAEMADTVYEKHLLPKPNLADFDQEASNIIKQQVLLHRELTDLTDFSLLE